MIFKSLMFRLLVLAVFVCAATQAFADETKTADSDLMRGERLFALKVLPLLKDKCLGCHGADTDDFKGEFSVLSRDRLIQGGESEEPGIVPGHPDEGTLVEAIEWAGLEMPPKENDRLSADQVKLVREWIELGAPWPSDNAQKTYRDEEAKKLITEDGRMMVTSGGTSAEWTNRRYQEEDLWAFLPLRSNDELLPEGIQRDEVVDYFINQKLAEAEVTAAPEAKPRELLRRATLDLTGLPPTPDEAEEFEAAYSQDAEGAWSDLIDRLLASPRYGEHWGRHWLDVTRYADTGGMSNDYERSNMWRYRDYVIRSFNEDKPYNEFIVEQLAGDELADQSVRERTGGSDKEVHQTQLDGNYTAQEAEWIVATGFLRLGPWDNAMIETEEARQIYLDDVVNITGQTFLAQTLRCCKCHDHKFDPLPTRDYYSVYAAFATTQMAERKVPFYPEENLERFEEGKAHVERMLKFAVEEKDKLVEKREAAARAWFEEHGLPYSNDSERKDLPDEEKPPRHVGLDHVEQGQLKVREQDEWIWNRRLERYQPMAQSVYNSASTQLAWNGARKLRIDRKPNKATQVENHILLGGALTALGDRVLPGVLSAVSLSVSDQSDNPYALPSTTDGRRLGLARWIAHPENPLTSRSFVNRVWQYHFGRGIAENANNFGAKGAKPTHPELLDFLANDFVSGGWTLKRMHRLLMMSEAYRRSTVPVDLEKLATADPDNKLLSHFSRRRLSAEELRDSVLVITDELVLADGGLPIKPEINMEVALQPRMIQFSLAPAYQPSSKPEQRNRRSVYAYQVRGQADPFTELFNQPNPNESCELRESASVTPQVFTLLNSDMITDRAVAFAIRLQSESEGLEQQIDRAFEHVLLRSASESELVSLTAYVSDMTEYHKGTTPKAPEYPTMIVRSLVEEFSGKPFEYTEVLPVFENYVPDVKPSDVDADTRALADVCLLLFNANEFMYVE